ncbi:MAG TPA: CAP domain-containing protein [Terriglobales bacterium]|nr:CAP domain-containing protein [Terriglobales bacterium]
MDWALIVSFALLLKSGAPPAKPASQVASAPATSANYQPSPGEDSQAERQLLDLANQARAAAGVPPLSPDDGLAAAASAHNQAMANQQQLSHQFPGEPSLAQRVAQSSNLHLDRAGENVAVAETVDGLQNVLMHSPPHRENLLNPEYNVAGFSVIRLGERLYAVQDFGHQLPTLPPDAATETIAAGFQRLRDQDRLPALSRSDGSQAQAMACAMAKADALNTLPPQSHYVLRYTTMDPGRLPAGAEKVVGNRALRSFSVGSCYARTATYPNGVYWVALLLD